MVCYYTRRRNESEGMLETIVQDIQECQGCQSDECNDHLRHRLGDYTSRQSPERNLVYLVTYKVFGG
jgi:hypothetical protein